MSLTQVLGLSILLLGQETNAEGFFRAGDKAHGYPNRGESLISIFHSEGWDGDGSSDRCERWLSAKKN